MKHSDIKAGMVLRLKRERQEAYGEPCPLVTVTHIKHRDGYSVPWIQSGDNYYRPQDFQGFESWSKITHAANSLIAKAEGTK